MSLSQADWLAFCRRAADAARDVVNGYAVADRAAETGRGEGGDVALVIDRAAEDTVFEELEALGEPVTAVSEERGELRLNGGGPVHVVIDPVDGSLNAKRGLPFAAVSIAVAEGPRMADAIAGCVAEFDPGRDWWAARGEGAWCDGERLPALTPGPMELVGLETARPDAIAANASQIGALGADRVRAMGAVAVTLCMVAAGKLDAMISLRDVRSVDVAAGQLIVREAGGSVAFPASDSLGLDVRSRVVAARDEALLERLAGHFATD
jgi:myo-inositol-1(or 4)-monophosphatase